MSSGHRAQNSLHLKIACSAPVLRDYPKPASLGESKGSVPCQEQKVCCNPDTQANHARAYVLCACPQGKKARVQEVVRSEGPMFAAERLVDDSDREADLGSFDRDG
jgi:hypothetical protein